MDHVGNHGESSTLLDYVRVLRRRKWIVLQAVVLVPLAALLFSLQQSKEYQASSEVYFSNQNLGAALTNIQQTTGGVSVQADRVAQTQADLARVPIVAANTLRAVGARGMTPSQFLAQSSVTPKTNADLLQFSVTTGDPGLSARLATAYAGEFRRYKQRLDTLNLKKASAGVRARVAALKAEGDSKSQLYASLVENLQTLETLATLQTANAYVVRAADKATQVQPKPVRNGILGVLLGLVLGVGLAFLWEALDTRVRSAEEVAQRLQLPLLARLPAPPKALRSANRLAMVEQPAGTSAEAFRILRTNIEFSNVDRGAKVIMVTSAVEGEGKSTTAANLAVAYARAGAKTLLVDLDLRRPFVHEFFDAPPAPGITDVAIGVGDLVEVIRRVSLTDAGPEFASRNGNGNGNGHRPIRGLLEVLPSGTRPPDPGEFLGTQAMTSVMKKLRDRAEIVIVDAAPLLHVGDTISLMSKVDGVLLVAKLQTIRRPMLDELDRLLSRSPAALMGVIATGAEADVAYGYGYGYAYAEPSRGWMGARKKTPARAQEPRA